MQTNRQACLRLILLLLLAAVPLSVFTAETENRASATAGSTPSSEEPAQTATEPVPGTQQATEETPPDSGAAVTPIKEFKPTEKIEADSAVSFPIDI